MVRDTAGFRIELAEGSLDIHDLTVGDTVGRVPLVVAVHGITANGLSWQCVADVVASAGSARRGRHRSRYGFRDTHSIVTGASVTPAAAGASGPSRWRQATMSCESLISPRSSCVTSAP